MYSLGPATSWKICTAFSRSFSLATCISSGACKERLVMGASRSKLGSGSSLVRKYAVKVLACSLRSLTRSSSGDEATTGISPPVALPFMTILIQDGIWRSDLRMAVKGEEENGKARDWI
jgi:hypothetical protein